MVAFRIYTQPGCPHCAAVLSQLAGLSVEEISIGEDPILAAGIRAITGSLMVTVPVIVSFITGEVIVGNKPEGIARVIDLYRRTRR